MDPLPPQKLFTGFPENLSMSVDTQYRFRERTRAVISAAETLQAAGMLFFTIIPEIISILPVKQPKGILNIVRGVFEPGRLYEKP
jgi:hypothetical protein